GPDQHLAAFLDEPPFRGNIKAQSFTFTSSEPVGAIALQSYINERADFLMATLPVAQISLTSTANIILPLFTAGGGWTTQILLVNPTDAFVSGRVDMDAVYSYAIAPRSAVKISTSTSDSSVRTGAVRIIPDPGRITPFASSIFKFVSHGVTVTESGIAPTGS